MALKILLLSFISVATVIYLISGRYLLDPHHNMNALVYIRDLYNCIDKSYPETYYRKRILTRNDSYLIYAIKIGKIFIQNLHNSQTLTNEYSYMIHSDLMKNRLWMDKSNPDNIAMRQTYETLYSDFRNQTDTVQCNNWNTAKAPQFFKFIQFNAKRTKRLSINFYDLLPIEHIPLYSDSEYATVPTNFTLPTQNTYFEPILFSYTISSRRNGALKSLQFRFGEIINALQHDSLKHIVLNGLHTKLLWAGEAYFIYDHKYGNYVFVMDNNSGHWKPKQSEIPYYLEDILLQTLFPDFVEDGSGYKPVLLLDYHDRRLHRLKKQLFPILHDINDRDIMQNEQRKAKLRANRGYRNDVWYSQRID